MGLQWLNGGQRLGELTLNMTDSAVGSNPYYGGAPACIDASGVRLCKDADIAKFVGVFVCSSSEDRKNGNASIITGVAYLRLVNGSTAVDSPDASGNVIEGAPYDTTKTFAAGERLYIDANGLWTNVADAGKQRGLVLKAPTSLDDTLEMLLLPGTFAATA